MTVAPPAVAIVGPRFFSYVEAVARCFAARGIRTEFFDERHANAVGTKALYRIGYFERFPARKRRHLDGIRDRIVCGGFTHALLVDVEVCDLAFVADLRARGVSVSLYMWDSTRNKPRFVRYLSRLHGRASFDHVDCRELGLTYIPLFAEDAFRTARQEAGRRPNAPGPVTIAFAGTLHSNRAGLLAELDAFARARGVETRLLLYYHSRGLLFLKSVVKPGNLRYARDVSTAAFSKERVAELFASSTFVFDIPHPGQQGITARTFEALRAGSRVITFNEHARELPPGLARRVVIVRRVRDLHALDLASVPALDPLTDEEDRFLSIDRFVDEVARVMGLDPGALAR